MLIVKRPAFAFLKIRNVGTSDKMSALGVGWGRRGSAAIQQLHLPLALRNHKQTKPWLDRSDVGNDVQLLFTSR